MYDSSKTESENVESNIGLVIAQAMSFRPNRIVDTDDLIQVGYIGLLKAVRKFDESRGAQFGTYAYSCIRGEILRELKKNKVGLNTIIETEAETNLDIWEFISDSISPVEKKVVMMRIEGHTYQEIGTMLGYTRAWANSVVLGIVERMREIHVE